MRCFKFLILCAAFVAGSGSVSVAAQEVDVLTVVDELIGRYDYSGALDKINGLITVDVQDSVAVASLPDGERAVQRELQKRKAQCLKKLYNYEGAVEAFGAVLALDSKANPVPVLAEIADCNIQQGNLTEALNLYGLITVMDPANLYFRMQKTVR